MTAQDIEKFLWELQFAMSKMHTALSETNKIFENLRREQHKLCGHKVIENAVEAGEAGVLILPDQFFNPQFVNRSQVYRCVECGHADHIKYHGFLNSEIRRKE